MGLLTTQVVLRRFIPTPRSIPFWLNLGAKRSEAFTHLFRDPSLRLSKKITALLPLLCAVIALLLLMLLFATGRRWSNRADTPQPASDAGPTERVLARAQASGVSETASPPLTEEGEETLAFDNNLISLAGQIDVANRYSFAVRVTARFNGGNEKRCSGVAVAPRVVLTAGHCVCREQERTSTTGSTKLINNSSCAANAIVQGLLYEPPPEGDEADTAASTSVIYKGSVHPHPRLRITLDDQHRVMESRADLAVILLDKPLDKEIQPILLADVETQVGESLALVGHGYDEILDVHGHDRRFSKTRMIKFLPNTKETALLELPGGHIYKQDSGGPCLREAGARVVLVGISNRGLGEGTTFTSIYGYRGWIDSEIQRVSSED